MLFAFTEEQRGTDLPVSESTSKAHDCISVIAAMSQHGIERRVATQQPTLIFDWLHVLIMMLSMACQFEIL